MAYTEIESNPIPEGAAYYSSKMPLGDYNFYLQFDSSTGTVVTRCDLPSGIRAATQRTLQAGDQIRQWRVEANETEATVYAVIATQGMRYNAYPGNVIGNLQNGAFNRTFTRIGTGGSYATEVTIGWYTNILSISDTSEGCPYHVYGIWQSSGEMECNVDIGASGWQDYEGKRYWYAIGYGIDQGKPSQYGSASEAVAAILPSIIKDGETEEKMVGRFAINLGDAGGYPGGGGDWTQPGDWNSDPTTTLHLTVNGALSGRHNDPIDDPSYSYVPAENTAEAGYGCGGGGGHGGGGGGGASTVIVRQFATNKANSKDITVLAKRHGYGSGGGKGGKGGDGCILVYY